MPHPARSVHPAERVAFHARTSHAQGMSDAPIRLLAVIPTYNERDNVGPISELLMALPFDVRVLFVDDDSPDGTADAVRELGNKHDGRVEVLVRKNRPRGLGNAYKDGFAEARSRDVDVILQIDADGQHPVSAVPQFVTTLLERPADLVIGSRYVDGGGTGDWGLLRRMISKVGGGGARWLLGIPYRDLTGGFKLWSRELLASIELDRATSAGFVFQIEMTLIAHRKGARIVESPFTFGLRARGESKMSWKIMWEAGLKMLRWCVLKPKVAKFTPKR